MNSPSSRTVSKSAIVPAAMVSLALSLGMFGVLYSVIKAGNATLEKKEALPTIDFVRLKRDTELETLSRSKPPPPPPAPPPPTKMKIAAEAVSTAPLTGLEIPNLNLKADVGGEALVGSKGSGGAAMFDGDIIPLQCPPVSYPADARRAGLTGWVQIEFLVGPDGSVRTARAVDAQPKGVFEAAAVMAAQRCKFKPKMVDGKAVEQRGKRKWNFDLNKSAE